MKVVLFCGGFGMRLREYSEAVPKPMVTIGYRPILWHIMKYYAHFGHKDFILCLGWQADVIKDYFLNYNECQSNDFVLSDGGSNIDLLGSDIHDWRITFVDTGTTASIGERLKAVEPHVRGEETFLANYADGLSNVDLSAMIDYHNTREATATFLSVKPSQSFHRVMIQQDGRVTDISAVAEADIWINAGYFVLNQSIFGRMNLGEYLVEEPFRGLINDGELVGYKHDDFYACMDTFKEKQLLDEMYASGQSPWEIWKQRDKTAIEPASHNPAAAHSTSTNGASNDGASNGSSSNGDSSNGKSIVSNGKQQLNADDRGVVL